MKPFVSVLVPSRNEVQSLGRCLASIVASDYPVDRFEVLVIDGASTDGTRELIAQWAAKIQCVRVVENPQGTTPVALNRGIAAALGDVIARVDAHAAIAPDYLSLAVELLASSGAQNVGGSMLTCAQREGPWTGAVIAALTHRFGVGGSRFRTGGTGTGEEPRWVDTVFWWMLAAGDIRSHREFQRTSGAKSRYGVESEIAQSGWQNTAGAGAGHPILRAHRPVDLRETQLDEWSLGRAAVCL